MERYHVKTFYTMTGDNGRPLPDCTADRQTQRWLNQEWEGGYDLHSIAHAPATDELAGITVVTTMRTETAIDAGYRAAMEKSGHAI